MSKRIFGISILVVLLGFVIYNFIGQSEAPEIAEEGKLAPNFTLETLSGEEVQLSDYFGKKIMLNFWATHCKPCREEMPAMQQLHDEYHDELEIIAVNLTGTEMKESDVHDFISEFEYTFPVLLDSELDTQYPYQTYGTPITYFIGTDGKIQAPKKMGLMSYEFMVETIEALN